MISLGEYHDLYLLSDTLPLLTCLKTLDYVFTIMNSIQPTFKPCQDWHGKLFENDGSKVRDPD